MEIINLYSTSFFIQPWRTLDKKPQQKVVLLNHNKPHNQKGKNVIHNHNSPKPKANIILNVG